MLGREIEREAQALGLDVLAPGKDVLDVQDKAAVMARADWVRDGWVVHCAARVDVEGCARDPDAARAVIVDGSRHAVALAKAAGARLFYPQSFLVYDGASNPIAEDETPRPLSLYGQLKYEAEQVILDAVDDALVVRMAGFFGGEAKDKNFVGRIIPVMFAAMQRGETSFKVGDRVWQPTWTRDLAVNSLQLMLARVAGRWQMACHGQATFAELAQEIVVALGWADRFAIDTVDATLVAQSELGRRPDVAILSCGRLKAENMDLQRDWRATLHAYLRHPFFNQYRLKGA
jgi:dTDP-4-dehydrorhamnose reductase